MSVSRILIVYILWAQNRANLLAHRNQRQVDKLVVPYIQCLFERGLVTHAAQSRAVGVDA